MNILLIQFWMSGERIRCTASAREKIYFQNHQGLLKQQEIPPDKPVPVEPIKRLVKARVAQTQRRSFLRKFVRRGKMRLATEK
jgi:hypothetical protein